MNPTLKHVAERVLVGSGAARLARRRLRNRTLVLAYHNVLPDDHHGDGDLSLHLPRREFARQLDHLAQSHEVVSIESLLEDAPASARPRVVVTFDDAYAGALTCGVDELAARAMPATIFVSPQLLGAATWWDELAARWGGVIPEDLRRNAMRSGGGLTPAIQNHTPASRLKPGTSTGLPRIGTYVQLSEAATRPGITIGSHTWSHSDLPSLRGAALESELSRPLAWLRTRIPATVSWLSYPYGHYTDSVQRAAESAGYRGAFRIDGGWVPTTLDSLYAIPRLNIPAGLSVNGFRLRLAGL